jgi:hypothetical protein
VTPDIPVKQQRSSRRARGRHDTPDLLILHFRARHGRESRGRPYRRPLGALPVRLPAALCDRRVGSAATDRSRRSRSPRSLWRCAWLGPRSSRVSTPDGSRPVRPSASRSSGVNATPRLRSAVGADIHSRVQERGPYPGTPWPAPWPPPRASDAPTVRLPRFRTLIVRPVRSRI